MPKTKQQIDNDRKDKFIREQLYGKMKTQKVSSEYLASMLGMSLRTFYRMRNEPERMTVRDIRIIREVFPDFRVE